MSIKKIVLATKNKGKVKEIQQALKELGIEIVEIEGDFSPEENGATFKENAYIKAYEAAKIENLPALADDSGLEVDALDGRPGIHSSRYANTDKERIQKLVKEITESPKKEKSARFKCEMVLASPSGETLYSSTGTCEGEIIDTPCGTNGFGYDPVFYIKGFNATMAEINLEQKNKISHRGKALKSMIDWLKAQK